MKIEEQILTLEQIQELQELGFNDNKYASVEINTTINKKQYIVSSSFVQLYPEFGDNDVMERYMTMTIGDIINILPEVIKDEENDEEYNIHIGKNEICYSSLGLNKSYRFYGFDLITNLFRCLKWCIKEKYINL